VTDRRRTDRLDLRRITAHDVPAVVAISTDPRTNLHRPGGTPSLAEAELLAQEFMRGWDEDGIGFWVVEHEGEVVGIAGVRPYVLGDLDCWNLYYRFAPEAWGKGFAVEAAREAIAVAREQSPPRPVVARTRSDNAGAVRVAERAGLVRRPDLDADGYIAFAG
jgi:ribosomal-protein-alanine N-acetyltransferase